jgi:hypothetical protein
VSILTVREIKGDKEAICCMNGGLKGIWKAGIGTFTQVLGPHLLREITAIKFFSLKRKILKTEVRGLPEKVVQVYQIARYNTADYGK